MTSFPFKLLGLTDQHKAFLYAYAQAKLGSKSRTKAILDLINVEMMREKSHQLEPTATQQHQQERGKKKRVQISLREHDYNNLAHIAESTDTSITNYIIRLVLNDIYNQNTRLLGNQIEQLKKSNYELHKIGVNINQIAKALNANEDKNFELSAFSSDIKNHVETVKSILMTNSSKY